VRDDLNEVINNDEFQENTSGYIYSTRDNINSPLEFIKYDIKRKTKTRLSQNLPCVNQMYSDWDMEDNYIACVVKEEKNLNSNITIYNLHNFSQIKQVDFIDNTYPSSIESQTYHVMFRLSPDGKQIAILQNHSKTPNVYYNNQCFHVPDRFKLLVVDTTDGSLVFRSNNYYSGGKLAWSANSNKLFVTTFFDSNIYNGEGSGKCINVETKGISYDSGTKFVETIFEIDLPEKKRRSIVNAKVSSLFFTKNNLFFSSWKDFYVWEVYKYDLSKEKLDHLGDIESVRLSGISPNGKWLMGNYKTDIPVERFSLLLSADDLDDRLVYEDFLQIRTIWVENDQI